MAFNLTSTLLLICGLYLMVRGLITGQHLRYLYRMLVVLALLVAIALMASKLP